MRKTSIKIYMIKILNQNQKGYLEILIIKNVIIATKIIKSTIMLYKQEAQTMI